MDKRRDSHPLTGSAAGGASPSDERAPTAPAAGAAAVSAEPGDGAPQETSDTAWGTDWGGGSHGPGV